MHDTLWNPTDLNEDLTPLFFMGPQWISLGTNGQDPLLKTFFFVEKSKNIWTFSKYCLLESKTNIARGLRRRIATFHKNQLYEDRIAALQYELQVLREYL